MHPLVNRPVVAGAGQSSKHQYCQAIRPSELTFWENVHSPPHVTCHMSYVMCHMWWLTCHVSHVVKYIYICIFFLTKWWSLSLKGVLSTGPTLSSFFYVNNLKSTFIHTKKLHMKNLYIRESISTREIIEAYTQSIAQSGMNLPAEQGKPLKICPKAQGICLSQRRRFSLTQQRSAVGSIFFYNQ